MKFSSVKLLSVLMIATSLVACGGDKSADTTKSAEVAPTTPTTSGSVYRVGIMPDYAPYGLIDEKGQMYGLDIDVLQAIAKNQGFTLELKSVPWDIMPNALTSNEVDVIANGLTIDDYEEAGQTIVATDSYLKSADCIWAKDKEHLENWQKGRVSTPEMSGMADEIMEKFGVAKSQIVLDKLEFGSLQSLIHDRTDAVFSDCVALDYFAKRDEFKAYNFEKMIVPGSDDPDNSNIVFMVRQGDDELLKKINEGLANIKQSGELAQIEQKWH